MIGVGISATCVAAGVLIIRHEDLRNLQIRRKFENITIRIMVSQSKEELAAGRRVARMYLTDADVAALRKLPNVREVIVWLGLDVENVKCGEKTAPSWPVIATDNTISPIICGLDMGYFAVVKGRMFTREEQRRGDRVCLVSKDGVGTLVGKTDPIGRAISMAGQDFRVIGVTKLSSAKTMVESESEDRSPQPVSNANTSIHVPRLAAESFSGHTYRRVEVLPRDENRAAREIDDLLSKRIGPIEAGFAASAFVMPKIARSILLVIAMTGIMMVIAAAAGVVNVMLVSVTERRREFGIRRAVGATARDIVSQVLAESIMLCLFGGGIGVALATFLVYMGDRQAAVKFDAMTYMPEILTGVAFVVLIGVIGGVNAAIYASRLRPAEAIASGARG